MLHLIGALGLQVVGQDYSRPGAQEEVFRLKVRRVRESKHGAGQCTKQT